MDNQHLQLANTKKIIVTFAGIPGSGKTTIAKLLEEKLHALRVSSMDVQRELEKESGKVLYEGIIEDKRRKIIEILDEIADKSPNKLIILDKGIERTYKNILNWAYEHNYEMITIALDCPESILEERLNTREGKSATNYLANMNRWVEEYNLFMKENEVDMRFDTSKLSDSEICENIVSYLN